MVGQAHTRQERQGGWVAGWLRTEPLCWAGNGAPGTPKAVEAGQVLQQEKMVAEIWQ